MDAQAPVQFKVLIKQIKLDYWLLMIFVFFMKAGQFMLLPYLALFLSHTTHASPSVIGLVIGIGLIVYAVFGPISGWLIDHWGTKKVVIVSLIIAGLDFIFFNAINSISYYLVMNVIVGISRSLFDTATRSYKVSEMTYELRRICFSIRFTVLNSACAFGPWLGVKFIQHDAIKVFESIGVMYLMLSMGAYWVLQKSTLQNKHDRPAINQIWKVLYQDRYLVILMLASCLMWMSYSQLDATLPLYLKANLSNGVQVFAWLIIINAVGCAVLQIPVSRLMMRFPEKAQIVLGSLLFMVAFLILAFILNAAWLMLASFLIVLGENMIAPLSDMIVYHIAPKEKLGLYFGAMTFSLIGLGLGPIWGGALYQYAGAQWLFSLCAMSFILMGYLLYRIKNSDR